MTRNYTRKGDELTVYHDEFVVVPSLQGKGFAKDVMANSMDMYKAMGVDRIDMDASLSVGGYAWAKYGFLPDKAHWKTFAEDITYEPPYEDLPKGPVKSGISKILSSDDPHGMWALADSTVGKSLLLETEWHGSLYLKDPEQMARFNSYINKKKK
jgi:hypothetical protein